MKHIDDINHELEKARIFFEHELESIPKDAVGYDYWRLVGDAHERYIMDYYRIVNGLIAQISPIMVTDYMKEKGLI